MKTQGQGGKNNVMMASVVTLGILLLTSLIVMFLYINKSGKLNKSNDELENRLAIIEDNLSKSDAQNKVNVARLDSMDLLVSQMETDHEQQIAIKDRRIANLEVSGNKKEKELQKEIDRLIDSEVNLEKLQNRYDRLLAEALRKRDQIKVLENDLKVLRDSVDQSRKLFAYNISPLTKWDRWLCADRYNVDVARRVNEIHVKFEIAGSPFVNHGKRNVYLNLLDPQGNLLYPQGGDFQYTVMQEIDYSGSYIPVEFIISNPEKLLPGTYTFQVYIGNELVRETYVDFN